MPRRATDMDDNVKIVVLLIGLFALPAALLMALECLERWLRKKSPSFSRHFFNSWKQLHALAILALVSGGWLSMEIDDLSTLSRITIALGLPALVYAAIPAAGLCYMILIEPGVIVVGVKRMLAGICSEKL